MHLVLSTDYESAKLPFMPLLLNEQAARSRQPTLAITVQLHSPIIQQQWLRDGSAGSKPLPGAPNFKASRGPAGGYSVVQYYLSRATLDQHADGHGLTRLELEEGAKAYRCPLLIGLTHLLLSSIDSPELVPSSFKENFVTLMCAQVIHLQNSDEIQPRSRGGLSTWQKRRALEILNQSCYETTRLSVLARECRLSVSHFARSFKTSFGMTVHRWILCQRIERAKELLLHSDKSLVEVAGTVGFSDQASFNRMFTKMMGSSPGRWRRVLKEC